MPVSLSKFIYTFKRFSRLHLSVHHSVGHTNTNKLTYTPGTCFVFIFLFFQSPNHNSFIWITQAQKYISDTHGLALGRANRSIYKKDQQSCNIYEERDWACTSACMDGRTDRRNDRWPPKQEWQTTIQMTDDCGNEWRQRKGINGCRSLSEYNITFTYSKSFYRGSFLLFLGSCRRISTLEIEGK